MRRVSDNPKEPSWFAVTREQQQQLEAWSNYSQWRLGFELRGIGLLREFKIESFLVPCEWPEWFDSRFARAA